MLRVCAIALLAGCATASVAQPESTLEAYASALRAGDARAAYEMLDEETQQTVPYERFAALFAENRDELSAQATEIDRAVAEGEVMSRAEVPLPSGEDAILTIEDRGWRLLGGVLDAPALLTPQDAVLALRHALQRRDLGAVLRVLARPTRADLEAEIRSFLESTDDALDLEVEIQGNEARVRTTGGNTVRLVREAGEWRVRDVE